MGHSNVETIIALSFYCRTGFVVATWMFRCSASILGFKRLKLVLEGIIPFSKTMMKPAIPLAPPRWPIFDFTAPLGSHQRDFVPLLSTRTIIFAFEWFPCDLHEQGIFHTTMISKDCSNGICLSGIAYRSTSSLY